MLSSLGPTSAAPGWTAGDGQDRAGAPGGQPKEEACAMAGIGRTKIYEAIANGKLTARKCGKRTLILREELRQFLASLPTTV